MRKQKHRSHKNNITLACRHKIPHRHHTQQELKERMEIAKKKFHDAMDDYAASVGIDLTVYP